jgi:hypothetical protein
MGLGYAGFPAGLTGFVTGIPDNCQAGYVMSRLWFFGVAADVAMNQPK